MIDREGRPIAVGDHVRVHLNTDRMGTVLALGHQFVQVSIPELWQLPGGMLPQNLTVVEPDMDIGL